MKPSPTSPASFRAFGPYPATQTSARLFEAHGKRIMEPRYSTSRPFASSRITCTASPRAAIVDGFPLITRTAESPRPMPITVRLPNISFSVANRLAVTVQSRVRGFVTIGPTMTLRVFARICV